jgi:hypothetical protein
MKVVGQHACETRRAAIIYDEETRLYWHFWGSHKSPVMIVRASAVKSMVHCHYCHEQYWWVDYVQNDVIMHGGVTIAYDYVLTNPDLAVMRVALR